MIYTVLRKATLSVLLHLLISEELFFAGLIRHSLIRTL